MRNVTISYVNDDGEPMSNQGNLSDGDLAILIKMLNGASLDDLIDEELNRKNPL